MPPQMRVLRPILRIARQEKTVALEVGELLAGNAFFDEPIVVDDDAEVVGDGPKAAVELPVGILG